MKYLAFNFVVFVILPFDNHGKQLCIADIQGSKGEKGDTGNCVSSVNNSIAVETLTRSLRRGYMELDDGWISPFNGYQYKLTPNETTWEENRKLCQNWGGDLIAYGVRDFATRITITRALDFPTAKEYYWVGLNDITIEGQWQWVNGQGVSTSDVTIWKPGEPDGYPGEDCGFMRFNENHIEANLVADAPCTLRHISVCEKLDE